MPAGQSPRTSDINPFEAARAALGNGNWGHFRKSGITLDDLFVMADDAATALNGIERPWLCWNVDPDWNIVQQRLVRSVGWTPVVGYDPRVGPPPLEPGAIAIDFNRRLRLPTMWMHVPLEFVFRMSDRLAFWHADLLLRDQQMRHLAEMFAALPDGAMAAVAPSDTLRMRLTPTALRYWEVVGCTTRGASKSQFDQGCGWWMNFAHHPSNDPVERRRRLRFYWDCGTGIRYWHKKKGGAVTLIPERDIAEGHFTGINRSDYKRFSPKGPLRDLSQELSLNNDLSVACHKLGIGHLLTDLPGQAR